jgi:hypothetical protein
MRIVFLDRILEVAYCRDASILNLQRSVIGRLWCVMIREPWRQYCREWVSTSDLEIFLVFMLFEWYYYNYNNKNPTPLHV